MVMVIIIIITTTTDYVIIIIIIINMLAEQPLAIYRLHSKVTQHT